MRLGAVLALTAAVAGLAAVLALGTCGEDDGSTLPPAAPRFLGGVPGDPAPGTGTDVGAAGTRRGGPGGRAAVPGAPRRLVVVDEGSGAPVAAPHVRVPATDGSGYSADEDPLRGDERGVVEFVREGGPPAEVLAWADTHPVQPAAVTAQKDGLLEARLRAGARLTGRAVVPGGRPAPHVLVFAERAGGPSRTVRILSDASRGWVWALRRTDGAPAGIGPTGALSFAVRAAADGSFSLLLPAPGDWTVGGWDSDSDAPWGPRTVHVPPGGATTEILLEDACVVRLDVTGLESRAFDPPAVVRLVPSGDGSRPAAFGLDRVPALFTASAGAFRVRVETDPVTVTESGPLYARPGEELSVTVPAGTPDVAGRLVVDGCDDPSALRLFGGEGRRLGAVAFRIERHEGEPPAIAVGRAAAGPGRVLVVAPATGGLVSFVPPAGEDAWRCALAATGGVRVSFPDGGRHGARLDVRPASGAEPGPWVVRFEPDDVWSEGGTAGVEGRFRTAAVLGLPPGEHVVTVTQSGRAPVTNRVLVRAGSVTPLTAGEAAK